MPRHLVTTSTAALVACVAAATIVAQEAELRLRWTEGETLTYRTMQESSILMSGLPGGVGDVTIENTMTQVQQMTAEEVGDDGAATVRVLFEAMKINVSSPAGTISFDSANPSAVSGDPTGQLAQTLAALVGQSITTVIEPTGAVRSVSGASEIMTKMLESNPQLAQMMNSLGGLDQVMNDDGMKGALGQQFTILPSSSVTVGDSWQTEITLPNPLGTMTISTNLTLKGFAMLNGHEVARIGTSQAVSVGSGGMMGPMSVEVYDAYGEGEVLFDRARGRIHQTTNQLNMPMAMSMVGPDGSTVAIDAVTHVKTTIELVER